MLTATTCQTVARVAANTIRNGTATSTSKRPMPCVTVLATSSTQKIVGSDGDRINVLHTCTSLGCYPAALSLIFELTGTRAYTMVPRPGFDLIERDPLISLNRSCMLVRPRPQPLSALFGSKPAP